MGRWASGPDVPTAEEVRRRARFFETPEALRAWFETHHATEPEVWIAYYKAGAGRRSVTYDQAVEEALCFGWVDGQVRSLGPDAYANRYTPRKAESRWSALNVRRVRALAAAGRLHPAGRAAFERRDPGRRAGYSFEERPSTLAPDLRARFRADPDAWAFFQRQAPSYRRTATFWVMSARRDETRGRRLGRLITASRAGRRVDLLAPGRRAVPARGRIRRAGGKSD